MKKKLIKQNRRLEKRSLNAREVEEVYGLRRGKLYHETVKYVRTKGREGLRSIHIRGRSGRKGTRLYMVEDLEEFLLRHAADTEFE
jgi:hypothetical protein